MLIINDLLHGSNDDGSSPNSVYLITLLLLLLILGLESLLVLNEFLFIVR